MLYSPHPIQQLPPPFDYTLQLLPVSPLFSLSHPSPLPRWSHPSLLTVSRSQEAHLWHAPLAPPLALCRVEITMKDNVLMISIHFGLLAREYTSWMNPKIYDINILSSSRCGTTEKRAARMDGECHAGAMATFTNPLVPLPAHIRDRNHWKDYNSESAVLSLRCHSPSAVSPWLSPFISLPLSPSYTAASFI